MLPGYFQQREKKDPFKGWVVFLVVVLTARIFSYFMLSEDVNVVQLVKAMTRLSLTSFLLVLCFFSQLQRKLPIVGTARPLPVLFYLGYLALGMASLLWTSSLSVSALQLAMDAETLLFAYLFSRLMLLIPASRALTVISSSIFMTAVFFLAGTCFFPEYFFRYTHGGEISRLGGFIINPNELGMLFAFGAASVLPQLYRDEKLRISKLLLLLLFSVLTFYTESRSAFVALLLIIGLYAFTAASARIRVALVFGLLIALPTAGVHVFFKQDNVDEVLSMTGRIPFWHDLLTYNFPKAPFRGFGYMRIDLQDQFDSLHSYAGSMTHNTFLQVLLGLGLIGLLVVLTQVATFLHAVFTAQDKGSRLTYLYLFIPLFINSLTEFGIFGETNFGILFYLLLVFSVSTEPGRLSLRTSGSQVTHAPTPRLPLRPLFTA